MTDLRIDEIRFASASSGEAATGLLGYVSCTLNGVLRLDGLALRRTLSGALALSFPVRIDRAGRRHAYIRPLTNEARMTIEAQVFAALALQVEAAA
jgi:hypothetical protein